MIHQNITISNCPIDKNIELSDISYRTPSLGPRYSGLNEECGTCYFNTYQQGWISYRKFRCIEMPTFRCIVSDGLCLSFYDLSAALPSVGYRFESIDMSKYRIFDMSYHTYRTCFVIHPLRHPTFLGPTRYRLVFFVFIGIASISFFSFIGLVLLSFFVIGTTSICRMLIR